MGQTEGMVTPRCAASATWNPHVDVKGLEDAAGTGPWQCRRGGEVYLRWQWDMVQARDEVGQVCCIGYVASPM